MSEGERERERKRVIEIDGGREGGRRKGGRVRGRRKGGREGGRERGEGECSHFTPLMCTLYMNLPVE